MADKTEEELRAEKFTWSMDDIVILRYKGVDYGVDKESQKAVRKLMAADKESGVE